ncbi:MAG: hypothetical protein NC120_04795 [Ruminococcus sp.]|nr:hypothetical protein [Ruminococcus sp.]
MKIERMGKSVVKVTIRGCELDEMGLTYEDITAESPLTAALVSNLIGKLYPSETGKPKLNIEIFPAADSGCVMRISPRTQQKNIFKIIITVNSVENLFKVRGKLADCGISSPESCLTAQRDCLRITADIPMSMIRICDEIKAFSNVFPADGAALSYIFEHGEVVFTKNALSRLGELTAVPR